MGKFADAIRDRRKSRQRRLGFGAAADEPQATMLVGAIGVVEGADFCLALSEDDIAAVESANVDLWGTRLDALTAESVAQAKERGAAFVSFELDGARADGLLDEDIDFVVRLDDLRLEEADARALGSLRPAEIAVEVEFPVGLGDILNLRRLAMFASAPMGVKCPSDISAGDIEALRDSGVAVLVLGPGATAEEITAVRQRVADLPERKPKRDDGAQPLIPTMRSGTDSGTDED
ncbi:MAG: hypothetical protein OXI41_04605 [Chloroflexota bacterium]|nr:hypothetical protein [Chloroflexota bacterium]MDE2895411.1 hypothetical protein [Chloroflexota bacterium]